MKKILIKIYNRQHLTLQELNEFIDCILTGRKPEVTVYDGTKTTEIAYKCKEAFETNELIRL